MRERPIIFSGPMARAILAGQKAVTRRPVKPQPIPQHHIQWCASWRAGPAGFYVLTNHASVVVQIRCPYGAPGDRLWARETHGLAFAAGQTACAVQYHADSEIRAVEAPLPSARDTSLTVKRSPIHMPRWASRLTLEVVSVRVERLQAITEEEARAEGMDWAAPQYLEPGPEDDREDPREVGYPPAGASFARDNFRRLWDRMHGRGAWDANPWVWVIGFRRVTP